MPTIKLTKVNIGANRYFNKYKNNATGYVVNVETTKEVYDAIVALVEPAPDKPGAAYVGSYTAIGFEGGDLADNYYATQANGFHWVKINKYAMIKVFPEHITNNTLSNEGINYIKIWAGAE